jgi:hypothetical protein
MGGDEMSPRRKAEARNVRSWQGTVAAANELENYRQWVAWGVGQDAPSILEGEPANDVATGIASAADPEWAGMDPAERWAVTMTGEEADVEELLADCGSAMGHAPYLAPGKTEEVPDSYMSGTLRGDVAPRRKVDQPRPYGG